MSIESWKKEFMPVEPRDCPKEDAAMLDHALLKWEGLKFLNMQKHDLHHDGSRISSMVVGSSVHLDVDCQTCCLCKVYEAPDIDNMAEEDYCKGCPLKKLRGVRCDEDLKGRESPWGQWYQGGNPESMIRLLKKARKECSGEK